MERLLYSGAPDHAEVLRNHAARYSRMQPQDAVKLLFQSVFGPGHLIADRNRALSRLTDELKQSPSCESVPIDEIGGGFARMHLTPGIDADYALSAFLISAAPTGSREEMLTALELLRNLTAEGVFAFDSHALEAYLSEYIGGGWPMVSHTDVYRQNYCPSYRVVRREFVCLAPFLEKILRLCREKESVVVTVDGFCASGKSTLAGFLAEIFNARLIHMDDFFLPPEKRTPERFAEPGGNVDYERFKTEVADHLSDDELTYGVFDCSEMAVTSHRTLPKTKVTVVEGSYSHHPAFGRYYDTDVFMETSPEEQLRRIRKRDGEDYLPIFVNRWIPFEQKYESAYHVRENAEFIIET